MKIVFTEQYVQCFTDAGAPIEGISRLEIIIEPNAAIQARASVYISDLTDVEAHPLLSYDTLYRTAKAYGLKLVDRLD